MRAKILGLLRERVQEPVSGEEISAKLGVSRTAVWKHIQSLKNVGYDIESVPKKGYILHKSPDLLSPEEIVAHLETKWVGHHIHYLKEASSSNEVGKRLADQGCADGCPGVGFLLWAAGFGAASFFGRRLCLRKHLNVPYWRLLPLSRQSTSIKVSMPKSNGPTMSCWKGKKW